MSGAIGRADLYVVATGGGGPRGAPPQAAAGFLWRHGVIELDGMSSSSTA
jgi:hypothetical protein